jgi:hypothetical protein
MIAPRDGDRKSNNVTEWSFLATGHGHFHGSPRQSLTMSGWLLGKARGEHYAPDELQEVEIGSNLW